MNIIILVITHHNSLYLSFRLLDVQSGLKFYIFPLTHVEVWTGFVWLMIGTLNVVQPSAIVFCKRGLFCFVLVILCVAVQ